MAIGGGLGGLLFLVVALLLGVDPGKVATQLPMNTSQDVAPGFDLNQCRTGADARTGTGCAHRPRDGVVREGVRLERERSRGVNGSGWSDVPADVEADRDRDVQGPQARRDKRTGGQAEGPQGGSGRNGKRDAECRPEPDREDLAERRG